MIKCSISITGISSSIVIISIMSIVQYYHDYQYYHILPVSVKKHSSVEGAREEEP